MDPAIGEKRVFSSNADRWLCSINIIMCKRVIVLSWHNLYSDIWTKFSGLLLFCVLFSTLAWKGALAMYDSSDDVYELRADNFQQMVINSDFVWIVEFYAPW